MALLTPQQIKITGLAPVLAAANSTDTVAADERVFLLYRNTNAATRTITVVTPTKLDQYGQALPDIVITIAATTGEERIGPMTQDLADSTGLVTVNLSATANVTVAAIRI